MMICEDCGESVRDFFSHVCPRAKKSGGGVQRKHQNTLCTDRESAGIAPGPPDTFLQPRKRGKPRIGEKPPREIDRPWEKLGMSERTWQRRRAEARKKND